MFAGSRLRLRLISDGNMMLFLTVRSQLGLTMMCSGVTLMLISSGFGIISMCIILFFLFFFKCQQKDDKQGFC